MINIPMNTSPPVSLSGGAPAPMQQPMASASQQPVVSAPMSTQRVQYGGISLKKGQKQSLVSNGGAPLRLLKAGLCWETEHDLDVSCFMLGQNGKVIGDDWFVFYSALRSPDGALQHSGDSRDGALPGDDETISIDLSRLDPRVVKLVFVVTINEAHQRGLSFAGVRNAAIHIFDDVTKQDLCNFNLTNAVPANQYQQYYGNVTSMMVGELYSHNGQWKFNPIGDGTNDDLYGLCARYGVNVRE